MGSSSTAVDQDQLHSESPNMTPEELKAFRDAKAHKRSGSGSSVSASCLLQVVGQLMQCREYICLKLQGGMAAKQQMKALRAQKAAVVAAQAKQAEEQRAAAAKQVMTAACNVDAFRFCMLQLPCSALLSSALLLQLADSSIEAVDHILHSSSASGTARSHVLGRGRHWREQ